MSIENAISELAAAIRELAASNLKTDESYRASITAYAQATAAYAAPVDLRDEELAEEKRAVEVKQSAAGGPMTGREAQYPLEHKPLTPEPRTKTPAPGKAAIVTGDPEVEQAVQKVEAAAKEEKKPAPNAASGVAEPADTSTGAQADEPAALNYKTDVYPALVQVAKSVDKPALKALLAEFGASNGDQLQPKQYAAVVARAAELIKAAEG